MENTQFFLWAQNEEGTEKHLSNKFKMSPCILVFMFIHCFSCFSDYKKQNASNALVWAKMRLVTLWQFAALCSCFRPCSWLCLLLCPLTAFLHLDCSSCTPNIIQELGTAFQPGSAPASVVTYSWHPTPSWKQSMRHPGECHALPSEYWFSYFHLKKTIGCILPRSVGIS